MNKTATSNVSVSSLLRPWLCLDLLTNPLGTHIRNFILTVDDILVCSDFYHSQNKKAAYFIDLLLLDGYFAAKLLVVLTCIHFV